MHSELDCGFLKKVLLPVLLACLDPHYCRVRDATKLAQPLLAKAETFPMGSEEERQRPVPQLVLLLVFLLAHASEHRTRDEGLPYHPM